MRRWKVIKEGTKYLNVGDVVSLAQDDGTFNPWFYLKTTSLVDAHCCSTYKMVEIDEYGNIIRIYKKGDTLNEGILVGGNMNKTEAMKRLDAIEAEAKALRELIDKPDKIVYNCNKRYCLKFIGGDGTVYKDMLICVDGVYYLWHSITSEAEMFNGVKYSSAQEAINAVVNKDSVTIHVFDESRQALEFLMEGL